MNELQRLEYMEAMGVDCYVPRLVLPGAKPSEQCELPAIAVIEEPAANTAANQPIQQQPVTSQLAPSHQTNTAW